MEWKETARWIKFEENVEESNRWGKPHVASLTFHSLLELRRGLEKGTDILSSTSLLTCKRMALDLKPSNIDLLYFGQIL